MNPSDFYTHCAVAYNKEDVKSVGYIDINVLPDLIGKRWDELALGYVHALRPSSIRVTRGRQTCDSRRWRVTVIVDAADIITGISQEVEVGLPETVRCGSAFYSALAYGVDSPQCQFYNDDNISYYMCDAEGECKVLNSGKLVRMPV